MDHHLWKKVSSANVKKNISNLQTKLKAVNGINPVHDVHSKQGGA